MAARQPCPESVRQIARRKLNQINRVRDLRELAVPPGNRLEGLKGKRLGQYGIRINDQFRICFCGENENDHDVEIADYHWEMRNGCEN